LSHFSFLSSFDLDLFKFGGVPEAENASFGWQICLRVTLLFGLSRCRMRTVPSWACLSFFDGILI
jgi:hypothetical protein